MTAHYPKIIFLPCLLCCSLAAMEPASHAGGPQPKSEAIALFVEQHKFLENVTATMERIENFDSKSKIYRFFRGGKLLNNLSALLTHLPQTQTPFFAYTKTFLEDLDRYKIRSDLHAGSSRETSRVSRRGQLPPSPHAQERGGLRPASRICLARSTEAQLSAWERDVELVKHLFSAIDRLYLLDKPTPSAAIQYGINRFLALLSIAQENPIFRSDRHIEDMTRAAGVIAKPLKLSADETAQMKIMTGQLSKKLAEYNASLKN